MSRNICLPYERNVYLSFRILGVVVVEILEYIIYYTVYKTIEGLATMCCENSRDYNSISTYGYL